MTIDISKKRLSVKRDIPRKMNTEIKIIDTTLRDGEQAPGVCFPSELKLQILNLLYDAGIRDFEIGTPAIGPDEQNAIKKMLTSGINANLSVWCRAVINDLECAAKLGAKQVNLSLPVSDIQLNAIGKNWSWVFNQLKVCLDFALSNFDFVTVGAQDASRANTSMLKNYIGFALQSPVVKRIRLADTVGIMNPFTVQDLVSKMVEEFPHTEIEFHAHNDMGMATANALAAIVAGAGAVSTTINGLGERCGNAPLEEVIMALEYTCSTSTGIQKSKLQTICELVAGFSGRKLHPSKPFSGEMCFSHESGIHTRSLIIDPLAYQPFNPEEIGREMQFIFGKHSGSSAVKVLLQKNGIEINDNELDAFIEEIKTSTLFSGNGISESKLIEWYRQKTGTCHVSCGKSVSTYHHEYLLF